MHLSCQVQSLSQKMNKVSWRFKWSSLDMFSPHGPWPNVCVKWGSIHQCGRCLHTCAWWSWRCSDLAHTQSSVSWQTLRSLTFHLASSPPALPLGRLCKKTKTELVWTVVHREILLLHSDSRSPLDTHPLFFPHSISHLMLIVVTERHLFTCEI